MSVMFRILRGMGSPRRMASFIGHVSFACLVYYLLDSQAQRKLAIEIELEARRCERNIIIQNALLEGRMISEEELSRILRPYSWSNNE
jgi:hypothetical protein